MHFNSTMHASHPNTPIKEIKPWNDIYFAITGYVHNALSIWICELHLHHFLFHTNNVHGVRKILYKSRQVVAINRSAWIFPQSPSEKFRTGIIHSKGN